MTKIIQRCYLRNEGGGHSKHYFVAIVEQSNGKFVVHTGWGKIGASSSCQEAPYPTLAIAQNMYQTIINVRLSHGYKAVWTDLPQSRVLWNGSKYHSVHTPSWFLDDSTALKAVPLAQAPFVDPNPTQVIKKAKPVKKKEEEKPLRRKNAPWNF